MGGTVDLNIGIGAQDQFHFPRERRGEAAAFLGARGDSCFFMEGGEEQLQFL